MEARDWKCFLSANYRTAYYLTGILCPPEVPVYVILEHTGECTLIAGSNRPEHAVDTLIPLETYTIQRCLNDLAGDAAALLQQNLQDKHDRFGIETGTFPIAWIPKGKIEDALPVILALRKKKESDEVDEIRASLKLCAVAYDTARQVIRPGLTEVQVHNALYDAVMQAAGTTVIFAGDFACGERGIREGGRPTQRVVQPGDLYILDLFPAPALYFGDVCRAFVAGDPTGLQWKAWQLVSRVLRQAEAMVKPGVQAKDVYAFVKSELDADPISECSFFHHAGHGIGHHGHEAPRIIPGSDEIFEAGDVFTLEPGIYAKALQGGIRLEDNYLVTQTGIENLFSYPLDMK